MTRFALYATELDVAVEPINLGPVIAPDAEAALVVAHSRYHAFVETAGGAPEPIHRVFFDVVGRRLY